jgi:hypothetical protein
MTQLRKNEYAIQTNSLNKKENIIKSKLTQKLIHLNKHL